MTDIKRKSQEQKQEQFQFEHSAEHYSIDLGNEKPMAFLLQS
jgi:hypothetical protein